MTNNPRTSKVRRPRLRRYPRPRSARAEAARPERHEQLRLLAATDEPVRGTCRSFRNWEQPRIAIYRSFCPTAHCPKIPVMNDDDAQAPVTGRSVKGFYRSPSS
jgi:hypothetical protein